MEGVAFNSEVACTECGAFGAHVFEGEALCVSCYQARGSCCAERNCGEADVKRETRKSGNAEASD
jgi:hypothetical protein